jgi:hypothetical protein
MMGKCAFPARVSCYVWFVPSRRCLQDRLLGSKIRSAACEYGMASVSCVCAINTDVRHVLVSQVNSVNNDGARGNPERGPMPSEP